MLTQLLNVTPYPQSSELVVSLDVAGCQSISSKIVLVVSKILASSEPSTFRLPSVRNDYGSRNNAHRSCARTYTVTERRALLGLHLQRRNYETRLLWELSSRDRQGL